MEEEQTKTASQTTIISEALRERRMSDRRSPSIKGFLIGSLYGRRRGQRRDGGYNLYHSDWYSPYLLFTAVLLFALSCFDALLTVMLLNGGAIEVNPIMDFLLMQGGYYFIAAKLITTALCIFVLVGHHGYHLLKCIRVDYVLWAMVVAYSILITYEFSLLQKMHG